MKIRKQMTAVMLAAAAIAAALCACSKNTKVPDAGKASYEEVVSYLKDGGVISDDSNPIDINVTEGYVTDNTGGEFAVTQIADKAYDYNGLYLLWWDAANNSELYQNNFQYIEANGGVIVIGGGAAVMEPAAYKGCYAIAFSEDYAQRDAALELFHAMTTDESQAE